MEDGKEEIKYDALIVIGDAPDLTSFLGVDYVEKITVYNFPEEISAKNLSNLESNVMRKLAQDEATYMFRVSNGNNNKKDD